MWDCVHLTNAPLGCSICTYKYVSMFKIEAHKVADTIDVFRAGVYQVRVQTLPKSTLFGEIVGHSADQRSPTFITRSFDCVFTIISAYLRSSTDL